MDLSYGLLKDGPLRFRSCISWFYWGPTTPFPVPFLCDPLSFFPLESVIFSSLSFAVPPEFLRGRSRDPKRRSCLPTFSPWPGVKGLLVFRFLGYPCGTPGFLSCLFPCRDPFGLDRFQVEGLFFRRFSSFGMLGFQGGRRTCQTSRWLIREWRRSFLNGFYWLSVRVFWNGFRVPVETIPGKKISTTLLWDDLDEWTSRRSCR